MAEATLTLTAYSLAWLSRTMPAAAFWYYRTEAEALAVADQLRPTCKVKVREVQVPATFDRWSEVR